MYTPSPAFSLELQTKSLPASLTSPLVHLKHTLNSTWLDWFPGAAITKYHRLGGFSSRNMSCHDSRGQKIKVWAEVDNCSTQWGTGDMLAAGWRSSPGQGSDGFWMSQCRQSHSEVSSFSLSLRDWSSPFPRPQWRMNKCQPPTEDHTEKDMRTWGGEWGGESREWGD